MKIQRNLAIVATALVLVLTVTAPPAEAGGSFGVHVGSGGFGVSVGFGDWGVYTRSWSDPYWSLNFDATLAGYGEWVWVGGIGRVWRPWVSAGWRPYTHGRWVYTGYGWTWVAYEPWGYVPHHYGNWAYSNFGWVWQPGYSYTSANVIWVRAGGYVGWYARPPHGWSHAAHGFRHGYHHEYRNGYHHGYDDGWDDAGYATYVGWDDLGADNVSRYSVNHATVSRSRINARAAAPTNAEIRARGAVPVTETRLARRTVSMGGRQVTIARPEGVAHSIERNAADAVGEALAPAAIERRQPFVRSRSAAASGGSSSREHALGARELRKPESWQRRQTSSSTRARASDAATGSRVDARVLSRSVKPRSAVASGRESRSPSHGKVSRQEATRRRAPVTQSSAASRSPGSASVSSIMQRSNQNRQSIEEPPADDTSRRSAVKNRASARKDPGSGRSVRERSPRARSAKKR